MKKYNCEVYTIKERKVKDRFRYEIVEKRIYPNISKEKALYLAVKYGGCITGLDKNNSPCHPNKSDNVIGFNKWGKDIDLAVIKPVSKSRGNVLETLITSVIPEHFTLSVKDELPDREMKYIIRLYQEDILCDFSIEAYHIWAPSTLIPKGWEHITKGIVQGGDYCFRSNHHVGYEGWECVDASWSRYKVGKEIEYRGKLEYKGDHGCHKDGEVTYCYDPFVIRKKTQPSKRLKNKFKTK